MLRRTDPLSALHERIEQHIGAIYGDLLTTAARYQLATELQQIMGLDQSAAEARAYMNHWDQRDALVITYGDSILRDGEKPLHTLKVFADQMLRDSVSGLHILPF